MSERRAKTVLVLAVIWIVIIGGLALVYRLVIRPKSNEQLADETGSYTRYSEHLRVAADSFSGYAILRSETLRAELRRSGIKLTVEDDGADFVRRVKSLRDGDVQFAVFTVDSYLVAGAALGEFPGSIVLVLDETRGADAIVAYKSAVGQITDLDHADGRLVATPNSPSEFLARTVIAHFNLPRLPDHWLVEADGAAGVYEALRSGDKSARRAYVLWEPYVTMALQEPGAAVLLDSSKLEGYIVDVLVAERSFLRDHPDLVKTFVESYLRAAHSYGTRPGGMAELVMQDAKDTGSESLDRDRAEKLAGGILWKNTLENYAHFGLLPRDAARGLRHIEDIILNITDVLMQTGALNDDPVAGRAHTLFYDRILKQLKASSFHPGRKLNLMADAGGADEVEKVRGAATLRALTDAQWDALVAVGEMRTRPISFARGRARINVQSRRELGELAKRLQAWPHYYLTVVGRARAVGDAEANLGLARQRARAAIEVLRGAGIHENRIRAEALTIQGLGGDAQSVAFVVGQVPY